jgi:protein-S-isoprenylcysteine O-methyltransferase Ste14
MRWTVDALAAGSRRALVALLWLAPFAVLGLGLQAVLGGSWLAYGGLLLAGLALGARFERARTAGRTRLPPRLRDVVAAARGGRALGLRQEDETRNQKYLM